MNRQHFIGLSLVVMAAAALRLAFNHFEVWNFSPLVAVSLFAGARFMDKKFAFAVPFAVMLLTDWIIGFHAQMLPVYLSYALVTVVGMGLAKRENVGTTVASSLMASAIFFLVTNLVIWYGNLGLYPMTVSGQIASYTAALPFFKNALMGDLFFTGVLFGGWHLIARAKPVVQKAKA